ncbi:hypothetical protein A9R10_21335 [Aeromonas piscicola]|nr:hypothetical protein A9R10_21335 [Aeromonas piscicola]
MIEHIEIKRVHVDGGRHCYEKAPPAISFSMQPAKSRPMRFIRQGQKPSFAATGDQDLAHSIPPIIAPHVCLIRMGAISGRLHTLRIMNFKNSIYIQRADVTGDVKLQEVI